MLYRAHSTDHESRYPSTKSLRSYVCECFECMTTTDNAVGIRHTMNTRCFFFRLSLFRSWFAGSVCLLLLVSSSADHDSYVVMWHVYVGLCVCVSCMYIAMDFCQARTKRSDDRLTQNHLRPKIDQCYFLERKYGEIIKWKRLSFPISHHFVHVIKSFVFRQPPMSHAFDSCSPLFQSHPHSQTSIILWDDERAFLIRTHRHTYVRVHVNDSHM